MEDHRDAYLFDGCIATREIVVNLVKCFSELYEASFERLQYHMVTIALGKDLDDFIIIRSDVLQRKLLNISSAVWIEPPIIIDVNGLHPRLCTAEQILSMKTSLKSIFRSFVCSSDTYFPIVSDSEFESMVGFPFLAGWLLGYPCIYRSSNPHECDKPLSESSSSSTANALSMTCLNKISVDARLDEQLLSLMGHPRKLLNRSTPHHLCLGGANDQSDFVKIDLYHFTVPSDLVADGTFECQLLSEWSQRRFMKYEDCNSRHSKNEDYFHLVRSCDIRAVEITLPSVIL